MLSLCFLFAIAVLIAWPVHATQEDFTIDDSDPAVTYIPPDAWNSNGNCPNGKCYAQPDPNQIFMRTWHESTFRVGTGANNYPNTPLSVTVNFHGNSVKVYAVLPQSLGDVLLPPTAALTFQLDGKSVSDFTNPAVGSYEYRSLVFDSAPLPLGQHELKIINGKVNGAESLFILDKIVYSDFFQDVKPPPTGTHTDASHVTVTTTEVAASTSFIKPVTYTVTDQSSKNSSDSLPSPTLSFTQTPPPNPGQSTHLNTPLISSTNLTIPSALVVPVNPSNGDNTNNIPPERRPRIGIIVGATLGSFTGIVIILLIMVYRRRLRRKSNAEFDSTQSNNSLPNFSPTTDGGRSHASEGWVIASDTKNNVLTVPPPAYCP